VTDDRGDFSTEMQNKDNEDDGERERADKRTELVNERQDNGEYRGGADEAHFSASANGEDETEEARE
jgi:hypothetical protein